MPKRNITKTTTTAVSSAYAMRNAGGPTGSHRKEAAMSTTAIEIVAARLQRVEGGRVVLRKRAAMLMDHDAPQGHVGAIFGAHRLAVDIGAENFRGFSSDEERLVCILRADEQLLCGGSLHGQRRIRGVFQEGFEVRDAARRDAREAQKIVFTA